MDVQVSAAGAGEASVTGDHLIAGVVAAIVPAGYAAGRDPASILRTV